MPRSSEFSELPGVVPGASTSGFDPVREWAQANKRHGDTRTKSRRKEREAESRRGEASSSEEKTVSEVRNIKSIKVDQRYDLKEQDDKMKQAVVEQENSIVASIVGHDAETIKTLRGWDEEFNGKIDDIDFRNLEQNPRQLDEHIAHLKKQVEDSGGMSSYSDWATRKITKAAKRAVANNPSEIFGGGLYTTHHKIPQNDLKYLNEEYEKEKREGSSNTQSIQRFLKRLQKITDAGSSKKAFLNMPANLEVGPPAEQRVNDPGSGFDPNVRDGRMTPRSEKLSLVARMITQRNFDFHEMAKHLEEAQDIHEEKTKELLSDPIVEQWTKRRGNKFRRENE